MHWPAEACRFRQAQFLRQAILPSAEAAFTPPARLRRVGRDHLHSELFHRSADLRQPMRIDLLAGFAGDKEMAAAIAVQRAEQTFALDYFAQGNHHRAGGFFFHQLRVVDLARGVVQDHQQIVVAIVGKPAMLAAINVQQHARQGPTGPAPPM